MKKATHTDYKHPKHLRVEENGRVLCYSPSCSDYAALNRKGLPSWNAGANDPWAKDSSL